jgi:protein-disulfide isomerase
MALPAALASMAANEQGKFWEYHDKLFAEPQITPAAFERIATELELDLEQFNSDMKSPRLQKIVAEDMADAGRIGVTGTPSVFINGSKLKQRSLQGFQAQIDEALKKVQ